MKITYAPRRGAYFPTQGWGVQGIPPWSVRREWLTKVRALGFEGIEMTAVGAEEAGGSPEDIRTLRLELENAGVPCVAARTASRNTGAGFVNPRHVARHRELQLTAIRFAQLVGAPIVATTVGTQVDPSQPGAGHGEPTSQAGSRTARAEDFERNATVMRELADVASDAGLTIAIELAQHSVADNSWSMLHLLELIDRQNVGANVDLGNLYWAYDIPEESCESAIIALAPRLAYWHCKNLIRTHLPELKRSVFHQVPLGAGEIDYRFMISAVVGAGYDGCIAIEGGRNGDELSQDAQSVSYVQALLREVRADA